MAVPIQIDEQRVIVLHNAQIPAHVIAQRFGCSVIRIRNVLIRHGLDTKVTNERLIGLPGTVRRIRHCAGLGD